MLFGRKRRVGSGQRLLRGGSAACTLALVSLAPVGAQASTTPSAFVPPPLLAKASAEPDAKFSVIVQGADGTGTGTVAADVAAERSANPGEGKGVKRRFALLSGLSAELTGEQILKLAHHSGIAAITEDSRVALADGVPTVAPASTGAPAISGTAEEGATLTASTGTWSGEPTAFAYDWQRCGTGVRRSATIADAPVGLWPLDGDGADASGHGLAGTVVGGVSFGAGSAQLDGLTGAVTVPGVDDASIASGFTIEAWVKLGAPQTNRGIAGRWSWLDGGGALLWIDESGHYELVVTRDSANYLATTTAPVVGAWEHVVGTWDGATLRLYVNGVEIGSKPWTAPVGAPTLPFTIGDYDGVGHHLAGDVANVALYDHALPAARVERHFSGCEPIAGATASSYTATAGDVGATLRVLVTATNAAGSGVTSSDPTAFVSSAPPPPPPPSPPPPVIAFPPPANQRAPSVSGTAVVGSALTADPGGWSAAADAVTSYRWLACDATGAGCHELAAGTERTYKVTPGDRGSTLAVTVTVTDVWGSTSATSAPTAAVVGLPPVNVTAPTVSGATVGGHTLTAARGTWTADADAVTSYRWLACDAAGANCHELAGATEQAYVPTEADVGSTLAVTVTVTDSGGSASATSTPTAVVTAASPENVAAPTVAGTALEGWMLAADPGTWTGAAPIAYAYRWQLCDAAGAACVDIAGATARTYMLARTDTHATVRVVVEASNAVGSARATSAATAPVAALPNRQLWPYVTTNNRGWSSPAAPPTIAIVDSGIDASRPDFGGRVLRQVSLASVAPNSDGDGRGHGTFVAGVAAGSAEGYVGAEPTANLVSLDVLNDDGMATISDVIAAADWIYQHKDEYGIRVANFSLHGSIVTSLRYDPLDQAVEKLWLSGVVVVAAAGNYAVDGQESGVLYAPGNDPFVITVGATDIAGTVPAADDFAAPWSAFGHTPDGFAKPEVSAPGRYIVGPVPPGSTLAQQMPERIVEPGYMQMSGTSFATPMVAGAAARLLAEHPAWTPDQVKGALMLTATPLSIGAALSAGAGEINVAGAATVDDPPNPNLPLNQFLVTDPAGGPTPIFDPGAWGSAVSSGAWGSGAWGSGAWGSGAWGSGAWGSGAWGSGAWGSAYWSAGAWGSGVDGSAPPEGRPGAATANGDALEAGGYWLKSLDEIPSGQ
jgi:serine protease AprX